MRNRALVDLAGALRLPLLATNGVRYAKPEGKELFDAFRASGFTRRSTVREPASTPTASGT